MQGYVDGRLTPEREAAVEAYLEAHPEEAGRVRDHAAQRDGLRARLRARHDEPIPARLRVANIEAGLEARRRRRWTGALGRVAAVGLWLFVGAAGGWMANERLSEPAPQAPAGTMADRLAGPAMSAHRVFVAEMRHPVEVDGSQEAHLVQWLSKRLGRPLQVPNLSREGYRLMGGRLLPASQGAAALLMYSDETGRRLTVYLTVMEGDETSFRYVQEGEVGGFYWRGGDFGYAVFAQADRQSLLTVAEVIHEQTSGEGPR
nr:anti-sigma factor [Azospirillum sp. SYSU D00513]